MTETETFETIRYTADVVALTSAREVLLSQRGWPPHEGAWALPCGHVDPGETSLAAAARELQEERASPSPPMPCARSASGTLPTPTRAAGTSVLPMLASSPSAP
jgi:hypothetical protein